MRSYRWQPIIFVTNKTENFHISIFLDSKYTVENKTNIRTDNSVIDPKLPET